MRKLPLLGLTMFILCLSACSNLMVDKTTATDSPVPSNKGLATLDKWQLRGKLGIRSATKGTSANLQWYQNKRNYQLKLSGPLGTGTAIAEGDSNSIEVKQGSKTYRGTPQAIGQQLIGLPIPVDVISWWARGLPSPNVPPATDTHTDLDGKFQRFNQAGWQLSFSNYTSVQGYHLPTKLSGQSGDLGFKLIVSSWRITHD